MASIIQIILEIIKYGPSLIQIIQAILELLKNQGREATVTQLKVTRDYYRAKDKLNA